MVSTLVHVTINSTTPSVDSSSTTPSTSTSSLLLSIINSKSSQPQRGFITSTAVEARVHSSKCKPTRLRAIASRQPSTDEPSLRYELKIGFIPFMNPVEARVDTFNCKSDEASFVNLLI